MSGPRIAMIMAGGGGTRLWPASTPARPKPVIPGLGPEGASLLASTVERTQGVTDETWIVTTADMATIVLDAIPQLDRERIVIEPAGRNTAAALALACVRVRDRFGPDATMVALPADHRVADREGFRTRVRLACDLAESRGAMVTLGITPTEPAIGYGYLEISDHDPIVLGSGTAELPAFPVRRFVEKPDRATAERFLASGHYLWNAGIFAATIARWAADFGRTSPEIWTPLSEATDRYALERAYDSVPRLPVDVAVMEKLKDILAIPAPVGWSDLGTWDAVFDALSTRPSANVAIGGPVTAVDARGNLVMTDGATVGLLGVEGLIVVEHRGKILVTTRARASELRTLVDALPAEPAL